MKTRMSPQSALVVVVGGAVLGSALMLISLFVDWYSISVPTSSGTSHQSFDGWDSFEVADALFLFTFVACLWIGAQRLTGVSDRGFGWLAGICVATVFVLIVSKVP